MAGTKEYEIKAVVTDTVSGKRTIWGTFGEGDCSLASIQHAERLWEELELTFKMKRKEFLISKSGKTNN